MSKSPTLRRVLDQITGLSDTELVLLALEALHKVTAKKTPEYIDWWERAKAEGRELRHVPGICQPRERIGELDTYAELLEARLLEAGSTGNRHGTEGFQMTFPNGYTVSAQFHNGNYIHGAGMMGREPHAINEGVTSYSPDVEIAIWDSTGSWLTVDNDEVKGWVPMTELVLWLLVASKMPVGPWKDHEAEFNLLRDTIIEQTESSDSEEPRYEEISGFLDKEREG